MAQGESRKRVVALSLIVVLYLLAVALGAHSFPAYTNASGVEDLGHYYVPSLLGLFGRERAEYIWWLGTLPPPDHMVWEFPPGVFTLGKPYVNDLWFSGHTANAVLIALATAGSRPWLKGLAWGNVFFEILIVLSTRTHYTIDVGGGIFVAYTIHRVSLDVAASLAR